MRTNNNTGLTLELVKGLINTVENTQETLKDFKESTENRFNKTDKKIDDLRKDINSEINKREEDNKKKYARKWLESLWLFVFSIFGTIGIGAIAHMILSLLPNYL